MLFINNWNKSSLDKSSNSIVAKYKNKINSLTDKTDALRKLLGELYDEALILNERIKIDKQAIQEDLNDTADDLRATCGNSSWGQKEIQNAQNILDRAEEDIENIKTDIEITTGCLVVCQSGQGTNCGQPCSQPCNESTCLIGNVPTPCNEEPEEEEPEEEEPEEEDCVVIINGEFDCQGSDSYIDNCYGGCDGNQSCDSQTKVCPKCHGSEIDIVETCDKCDTDQKETCGTFDSQEGCDTKNETGDCNTDNNIGDCIEANSTGNCLIKNNVGSCSLEVTGDCGTTNNAENVDEKKACQLLNKDGTDCIRLNINGNCESNNIKGNCETENPLGDCANFNTSGSCKTNDDSKYCYELNSIDKKCTINNIKGDCKTENNNGSCGTDNKEGDCGRTNNIGDCTETNLAGNCETDNLSGDCTRDNLNGECLTQSCEAGQQCTTCIEDQKETSTTEKCEAGANIGDEEYCDTCQGDESKVEEWDQEELEDLCSNIFDKGADACGTVFAGCFNTENCNGASFGAESGCGSKQGCGTCDTTDSACDAICDSSQEPVCGTCDTGDGGCTGTCYGGDSPSCYPIYSIPGGGECAFGYNPNCGQGSVCPLCFTASIDCGQDCGEGGCDDGPDIDLD